MVQKCLTESSSQTFGSRVARSLPLIVIPNFWMMTLLVSCLSKPSTTICHKKMLEHNHIWDFPKTQEMQKSYLLVFGQWNDTKFFFLLDSSCNIERRVFNRYPEKWILRCINILFSYQAEQMKKQLCVPSEQIEVWISKLTFLNLLELYWRVPTFVQWPDLGFLSPELQL